MSDITVTLYGNTMQVSLSARALRALAHRSTPMLAEIHLIFGCMIVKRVRFKEVIDPAAVIVTDKLAVHFRAVRYQRSCRLSEIDNDDNPGDFPLVGEKQRFVPSRLSIDFRNDKWIGDFTYDRHLDEALR